MMNPEVRNSRMRDVIDYEIDYARKAFEKELQEELSKKDKEISKKDNELSITNKENEKLKAILDKHNIAY